MIEFGLALIASISSRAIAVLAVVAAQDHDVLVLLDHDAGEHAAVGRGDDRSRDSPRGSRRWG